MAKAVFLWHLHQPEYRDPLSGQPLLPWVRLHATRAYNDMAAALEKHDRARVVANWAPSLLLQLDAYASGATTDKDEAIARKPAADLTAAERAHVVKESFSVDWDLWVKPVPRYAELLAKRGADLRKIDLLKVAEGFSSQELLDLQVHFILGWMGFTARREQPLVAGLVQKQQLFTEAEKLQLLDLSRTIARNIVPRWKALSGRGIVEITCSPLFHPILPLLVDSDCARRAMPHAALPPRFQYPDDAREQVRRGLDRAQQDFGQRPIGMWPSEGSVSPEVLEILGKEGVRWCATDQGNLERSDLGPPGAEDKPPGALHFAPWMCGDTAMFFRDRELSDLIGFRYAHSDAPSAVADLVARIDSAGEQAVVTLALDGENPWEHYPQSGELFLDQLYSELGDRAALPRDLLDRPMRRIALLHSGSWIDSNFRIWIGHPEDNQAWALLGLARAALEQAKGHPNWELAYQACLAAEGSDWFWWYGDDFSTENAPEFDALFRRNVAQVFRHLGQAPPERLGRPIIAPYKDATQARAVVLPPRRLISPVIDGYSHGYYEWSGAGVYRPGQAAGGSMYQGGAAFAQALFGFSLNDLFVRLDPARGGELSGELRLLLTREPPQGAMPWTPSAGGREEKLLRMPLKPGVECPVVDERGVRCGAGFCGAIVELSLGLLPLGIAPGDRIGMLMRQMRDEVEIDRLPRYGELELTVPDRKFEHAHWHV
ncbi:MAG TPA: glycoside hydrolase family 57 protein [Myxococcales bacterium]|nr:glycoside hydrolase family 57 protein [Myxococcales bacterium]